MIQFLVDAFNWLVEFLQTIANLIISAVHGLVTVFQTFPKILSLVTGSLSFVPAVFIGFISITIIILIVYVIIGRESGES